MFSQDASSFLLIAVQESGILEIGDEGSKKKRVEINQWITGFNLSKSF
jgi:hypothetical protein